MSSLDIPDDHSIFKEAHGKVVVLTGGATGIGAATVRRLIDLGAIVSFLDTNKFAGEELVSDLGENVTFYHGSVTEWADQLNVFERTIDKHGRIDVVIANAGIDEVAEDAFTDTFDEAGKLLAPSLIVLDVNIRGVIYTTKLALSFFRKLNIKGSLVATGSAASYLDTPGIPVYNAAKHGVIGLVRSLRDTLAAEGLVRVNVVAPWFTLTPFTAKVAGIWQQAGLPQNTPLDVSKAIAFLALNSEYQKNPLQAARDQWLGKQNTAWVDQRKAANIRMGKQDEQNQVSS